MALADLIARAVKTYGFRPRGPFEGRQQYRAALIAHVQQRDYAMAHELRIGRLQADWTPDDVDGFHRHLQAQPRSPHDAADAPPIFTALDGGTFDPTEASLLSLARDGLEAFRQQRLKNPTGELLILANVLRIDGRLLIAPVGWSNRISILKRPAQSMPVFGFFLVFDAFMHGITVGKTATKTDALLVHIGTRDMRRMLVQRYYVEHGRVRFDPVEETDKRDPGTGTLEDPYADIFVNPTLNSSTVQ